MLLLSYRGETKACGDARIVLTRTHRIVIIIIINIMMMMLRIVITMINDHTHHNDDQYHSY